MKYIFNILLFEELCSWNILLENYRDIMLCHFFIMKTSNACPRSLKGMEGQDWK